MHPTDYLTPVPIDVGDLDEADVILALCDMRVTNEPDLPWDLERLERAKRFWHRSGLGPPTPEEPGYAPGLLRTLGVPIRLANGRFDAAQYDEVNGEGVAAQAVEYLRRTHKTDTRHLRRSRDFYSTSRFPFARLGVPASTLSGAMFLIEQLGVSECPYFLAVPLLIVGTWLSVFGMAAGHFD